MLLLISCVHLVLFVLQNLSLRDNITFGLPFDEAKYKRVSKKMIVIFLYFSAAAGVLFVHLSNACSSCTCSRTLPVGPISCTQKYPCFCDLVFVTCKQIEGSVGSVSPNLTFLLAQFHALIWNLTNLPVRLTPRFLILPYHFRELPAVRHAKINCLHVPACILCDVSVCKQLCLSKRILPCSFPPSYALHAKVTFNTCTSSHSFSPFTKCTTFPLTHASLYCFQMM